MNKDFFTSQYFISFPSSKQTGASILILLVSRCSLEPTIRVLVTVVLFTLHCVMLMQAMFMFKLDDDKLMKLFTIYPN